jgi:ribonuclease P protein component
VPREKRFAWPRTARIRKRADYLAVQSSGRKIRGRNFLVVVGEVSGQGAALGKTGITVSKRVGNAVTRNRIKRWVREYARQSPGRGWRGAGRDAVVIALPAAAKLTSFAQVSRELASLEGRL